MSSPFFHIDTSLLLVVDIQQRLWPHIANREQVRDRTSVLMKGAREIGVPAIVTEQYPKGLGPTLPELMEVRAPETRVCSKTAFGCLGDVPLKRAIERMGRKQLVVCGIETHVCVLQTVLEALANRYQVAVVADAVGSRDDANRSLGFDRMRAAGAVIASSEMILFEWMRDARHPAFKAISTLVK